MEKVNLSEEEYEAMETYLASSSGMSNEDKIKYLFRESSFLPLKKMGAEKFLQALFFGYEKKIELPTFSNEFVEVSSNHDNFDAFIGSKNPILVELRDSYDKCSIELNIKSAELLRDGLTDLIKIYYENKG